ncbi:hypothetical protein [Streptomyces sp. H27-D2]|uniref:hypothetical protein n=1 Tax=Streptomyces sp. H27-D2 TaxID=3046304 RepID=UPI002DBB826A|nr:hypothetical protein [Streptomyces sp. H27-D2]MEC4018956.1 hypothetical protein [Streptomyces sp. H27-D2]
MAERDADREDGQDVPRDIERAPLEPLDSVDEAAAWAGLVAAYGPEPDLPGPDGTTGEPDPAVPADAAEGESPEAVKPATDPGHKGDEPMRGLTVYKAGIGPRDWDTPEPAENDLGGDDEAHFTPPEPPPLPHADTTARFAWLAVLGGPLLLLVMILLRQELTWWITTLGVGGFLGGFGTLVARMGDDDDEENGDPGRGAVV